MFNVSLNYFDIVKLVVEKLMMKKVNAYVENRSSTKECHQKLRFWRYFSNKNLTDC